jgi:hypothetical protein
VTKMLYEEMKKGKSESVWGDHGDDRRNFLKILYTILIIGETARAEEWAGRPHPHQGDLLKGAGGGLRNFMAVNFAKAHRRENDWCEKCVKIAGSHVDQNYKKKCPNYKWFLFFKVVRFWSKHTP